MAHAASAPLVSKTSLSDFPLRNEANSSAVSWAAVIAGAFVAAALWLILVALGTGVGLSSVSPWSNMGASASAISAGAIVWLIVTQIISAAMGGYLAGRLRTKWTNVHTDEVYFRDTAHGFLVWSVGVVIMAALLAGAASFAAGTRQSGAEAQVAGPTSDTNAYFVDALFRSDHPASNPADTSMHAEAGIIFANALRQKGLSPADKSYLVQMVAATTGLSQSDAEQRVSSAFAGATQAADTARKAIAHSLYWMFLALLIGAFSASFAATIGGRQRDHAVAI